MILYRNIIKPLRAEIIKWLDVAVVPQNQVAKTPNYPYITYYMYEDWLPFSYSPDADFYNIKIQFKVVSDNEEEQKDLKFKLRRLFYMAEPQKVLQDNGIALQNVDLLPSPPTYLENFTVFDDGWDMTFVVNTPADDFTINKVSMDNIKLNFKGDK